MNKKFEYIIKLHLILLRRIIMILATSLLTMKTIKYSLKIYRTFIIQLKRVYKTM